MHLLNDKKIFITMLSLIISILVSINTSIDISSDPFQSFWSLINNTLIVIFIYLSPLFFLLYSLVMAPKRIVSMLTAWIAILIGGYFEYGYYTSRDPSKILLLIGSFITYWVCGLLAIFSYLKKNN